MEIETLKDFYTLSFRIESVDASITWRMDSRIGKKIDADDVLEIMISLFGSTCLNRLAEFASLNKQKMTILIWDSKVINCVSAEFDQEEPIDTSDFEDSYSPEEAKFGMLHYRIFDALVAFYLQRDTQLDEEEKNEKEKN